MQEFSGVSYRYRYVNTVWDVEQGQYIFLRRSGLISIWLYRVYQSSELNIFILENNKLYHWAG